MPHRFIAHVARVTTCTLTLTLALAVSSTSARGSSGGQDTPSPGAWFAAHVISADLERGYQPVVVDLNRDGRLDVIALSTGLEELAWFENPGWERHVITTGLRIAINVAPEDLDDDGIPELVLAHAFGTTHARSEGVILLLSHRGDPTQPWDVREIDRAPTSHRLRWATVGAEGRRVLINAPLSGPEAAAPDYRDAVPVYWYDPADWQRRVVTADEQGVVHGLTVQPWDDPTRDVVLTASFAGVHVHRYVDGEWIRTALVGGDPEPWPRSGASEIALGRLGDAVFLTTVEPWHGHQVVVYEAAGDTWRRHVIDTIDSGHTILTADFDGDGRDEVVTGGRGDAPSLNLYVGRDATGAAWERHVVDDGDMAASGCVVDDLDGDGDPDLVCLGGGTSNLKWYENRAR